MSLRKYAIAFALALFGTIAAAQTCPTAISTTETTTDQGSGPNYNFIVDGTSVVNGGQIGIHAITPTISASPIGWVDVRPGFNGCQPGWTYFIVVEWKVTRLSDGFTKTMTVRNGPHTCESASCEFNLGLPAWQVQLSLGSWQFESIVHSEVTSKEGVSYFSPNYTGSILIDISGRLP